MKGIDLEGKDANGRGGGGHESVWKASWRIEWERCRVRAAVIFIQLPTSTDARKVLVGISVTISGKTDGLKTIKTTKIEVI